MARLASRSFSATFFPTMPAIRSKEMFSSCPVSSFVAGVKIGSGSREESWSPFGSVTPQTSPDAWYSFHPEPAR
jgi:hypothetical protein